MGTAVKTARTSPASWDAFADVDAFVDEVLVELAAMEADGTKPTSSGPKPALTGAALRKAIMAIWCLCCLRNSLKRFHVKAPWRSRRDNHFFQIRPTWL